MRKVAIDFGFKRTGIAITDPSGEIVTSAKTIKPSEIIKELERVDSLSEVVFGFPVNLKMQFTKSTIGAVDKSIEVAQLIAPVPVYLVDERFTSSIANSRIKSSKDRKSIVDGLSASIILEDYIRGMKAHRVMWKLPTISNKMISFINAIGHFEKVCLVGSGLRGVEFSIVAEKFDIFEDDPAYFRMRQKRINNMDIRASLHFGVFWDIILRRLNEANLLVCDEENMNEIDQQALPPNMLVIVEETRRIGSVDDARLSKNRGAVYVGGRLLRILRT